MYSFLDESATKFWRKIYKLPRNKQKEVVKQWLLNRTKTDNLNDAANVWADKLQNGSVKKIENIADKNGRWVNFWEAPSTNDAGTLIDRWTNIDRLTLPTEKSQILKSFKWFPDKRFKVTKRNVQKSIRELNRQNINKKLNAAVISAHEADEYEQAWKMANKLGYDNPNPIFDIIRKRMRMTTGIHYPGVLEKEQDRFRQLGLMFDRGTFQVTPRTKKEFTLNKAKKKFK